MVTEIPLSQGKIALIDDSDYELVLPYKWCARKDAPDRGGGWYALGWVNGRSIFLHRFILGLPPSRPIVDHKDRDGLNCQRSNLRICITDGQSNMNVRAWGSSGLKGVRFKKPGPPRYPRPWEARIQLNGRYKHLGLFATAEEAASAYDAAASELFGEFACLNNYSLNKRS